VSDRSLLLGCLPCALEPVEAQADFLGDFGWRPNESFILHALGELLDQVPGQDARTA
jgi:hypothetical protein